MRPTYETPEDRERERAVALEVSAPRLMVPYRTPQYYACDWVFEPMGDNVREHWLVEVKVRKQRYRTYMLSLHKMTSMLTMGAAGVFLPVLIVAWLDVAEVGICSLDKARVEPGVGGRDDRGDKQDREPVVFVSHSAFLVEPFSPALRETLLSAPSHAR